MTVRRSLLVAFIACAVLVLGGSVALRSVVADPDAPRPFTGLVAPIPAVPGELRVTAAGDYSASPAAAAVLSRAGSIRPDFHVALGDLSYGSPGAEQAWCDFVLSHTGGQFPFQLVSGNHESNGKNGSIDNFASCLPYQLPGAVGSYAKQYYVDVPQVKPIARFVFISPGIPFPDGTWDYSAGSERYNWTAAAIDGARAASIPWVVVSMHTPCLSMGVYPCVAGEPLNNLLLSKKVDLVLNGHEHAYQRTKQLAPHPGCPDVKPNAFNASCVRDADNTLAKGEGAVFATVGTGGVALRDIKAADKEARYFAAVSGANRDPSHGLLDLRFTVDSLKAEFVATDGSFKDGFSIVSAGAAPAP